MTTEKHSQNPSPNSLTNSQQTSSAKFYRQFILEASKSSKHRGKIKSPKTSESSQTLKNLQKTSQIVELSGENPSCGDRLTLYLKLSPKTSKNTPEKILDAKFDGVGCAISLASAHFLCENLIGKDLKTARTYVQSYLNSLQNGTLDPVYAPLDNLALLPARIKCAALPWRTTILALLTARGEREK